MITECWSDYGCNHAPPCMGACRNTPKTAVREIERLRALLRETIGIMKMWQRDPDSAGADLSPIIEKARALGSVCERPGGGDG